jgi:hypothetical protein
VSRPWWTRPADDVAEVWAASDLARRGWLGVCLLAVGMAVVLLIGGPDRIGAAGFTAVRETGGRATWGSVFGLLGLWMALGPLRSSRTLWWAMSSAAAVYLLWAISFLQSAVLDPHSAITGPVSYGVIAYLHMSHAQEYRPRRAR